MTSPSERRAHVVGLGLIGGSVALSLGRNGWSVTGSDAEPLNEQHALDMSVIEGTALDRDVALVIIATPSHAVVSAALDALDRVGPQTVVTDVAGIKGSIVDAVADSRFIGGHPMAGSELRGLDGARADLFTGCTWVLTPTARTESDAYSRLHSILRSLDANVIALDHETHDRLVAMASHVPHLVAGALMNEASVVAASDAALLQLAAGGFRDMTRVSAGDPAIWPDVLLQNKAAVVGALRSLRERLAALERAINDDRRDELLADLRSASRARRDLPGRAVPSDDLAHLRIPVPDRPGVLADVTTLASEMGVNIYDIEIAHSVEGQPGVLLLAVAATQENEFVTSLEARGYRVSRDEST